MDPIRLIELACAVLILGAGVFVYRRRAAGTEDRHYDTQGAVLLFVVAVILAIHGSGSLDYHPSASELEMAKGLTSLSGH
jgi:hypothetical protein